MLNELVLVDTSAFAALFDSHDKHHAVCLKQFERLPIGKALTCWPVVTEAAYLARRYPSQRDQLLDSIAAGEFPLLELTELDIGGIRDIVHKYGDQQIDLADAALVHLANRESIKVIFTLDRRHFELFRRRDGIPFELLPELR